jgi:hypothetical protein
VISEGAQADQEDRWHGDHHPDTQLARPSHAPPLHGESSHEPVDPKRRPSDSEDELDRVHATQTSPVPGGRPQGTGCRRQCAVEPSLHAASQRDGGVRRRRDEHVLWLTAGSVVQGEHTDGGTWRGASHPPGQHRPATSPRRRSSVVRRYVESQGNKSSATCGLAGDRRLPDLPQ